MSIGYSIGNLRVRTLTGQSIPFGIYKWAIGVPNSCVVVYCRSYVGFHNYTHMTYKLVNGIVWSTLYLACISWYSPERVSSWTGFLEKAIVTEKTHNQGKRRMLILPDCGSLIFGKKRKFRERVFAIQ